MKLIERINAVIVKIAEDIANNSVLLPKKIGASRRWYQSGLRYDVVYPYPSKVLSQQYPIGGMQYFTPFTALENATISNLEAYCSTGQENANISLGIYMSDSNNDVGNPLFTSSPISCSTAGTKNASCNVQIIKGQVYWLSSLVYGYVSCFSYASNILKPIKGFSSANSTSTAISYYIASSGSMLQSTPINKQDILDFNTIPRVMFIVA